MLILKKTGCFKSFDDTQIYYEIRGKGEPLVFLYGIGCPVNHWIFQLRTLSHHYKTIVIDYRGHGFSSFLGNQGNQKDMSVLSIAKDVKVLMEEINLEKAVFIGHSFGTQVITCAYKMFPHFFKACVFINGFVSDPLKQRKEHLFLRQFFHSIQLLYRFFPKAVSFFWERVNNPLILHSTFMVGGFNKSLTSKREVEIYLEGLSKMDLGVFLRLFRSMRSYNAWDTLRHLEIPCLFIAGKKDKLTPESLQRRMCKEVKDGYFAAFSQGTHCTQLDEHKLVNESMDSFFKKVL